MRLRLSGIILPAVLLVGIPGLLYTLLELPEWMANQYHIKEPKDWAEQVTANRNTLVNVVGGLAVAFTIYFTAKTFALTQERTVTETVAKAIEQLGSTNISTRLGAIHILARIARSDRISYFPIMQIFAAFARTRGGETASDDILVSAAQRFNSPEDIRMPLALIGERYFPEPEDYRIDLSNMKIHHMWLPAANFQGICFWNTQFYDAMLEGTSFRGAELIGATFDLCNFEGVDFTEADMSDVVITRPEKLTKAQLASALNVPSKLSELAS